MFNLLDGGKTKYIRADKAVPEGFVLVPIEPTDRYLEQFSNQNGHRLVAIGFWEKIISFAAPQPTTNGDNIG